MRIPILLLMLFACFATGCDNPSMDWSQLDNVFADGPTYQPVPPTPTTPTPDPYLTPPCGPDGCPVCPYEGDETVQSLGTEVGSQAHQVNREATEEVKGDCPTCPNQVTRRPAIVTRPTYVSRPAAVYRGPTSRTLPPLAPGETFLGWGPSRVVTPASNSATTMPPPATTRTPTAATCPDGNCPQAVKEGTFACQRCKRPTVGAGWHELWADDGTALTCLCETCWRALSPSQRAAELQKYAKTQTVGALSPIVQDAIQSAAKRSAPANDPPSYGTEF